jgi:[acyl-carrier-protein] S-malonyltransferase
MAEALATVAKQAPKVPVLANVSVSPLTDPDAIAASLVAQVTGQVRWRESVEWFAANGVTTLYEIGSGKVLTGLAKRISKDVAGVAVNTADDVDALATALG